jgi:hypothetical protein
VASTVSFPVSPVQIEPAPHGEMVTQRREPSNVERDAVKGPAGKLAPPTRRKVRRESADSGPADEEKAWAEGDAGGDSDGGTVEGEAGGDGAVEGDAAFHQAVLISCSRAYARPWSRRILRSAEERRDEIWARSLSDLFKASAQARSSSALESLRRRSSSAMSAASVKMKVRAIMTASERSTGRAVDGRIFGRRLRIK